MGAMFPLTIRVWTAGGAHVGRDVGVVYAGNTVGAIVGAWLPGFVLFPLIGMEWTLHVGLFLNLTLALMMLIASAAEPDGANKPSDGPYRATDKKPPREAPLWHAVTVYILAPLIPALIALLWLHMRTARPGEYLRWNPSHMTLGVFRLSLAEDVLKPETWGEPDLVYYHDGLTTTVSVERWGRHYALKNNGKVDASNGDDMPTQIMVAGFPLLMHQDGPTDLDIAVIGFGSGVTVGTALQFPVRSVDVIELERSIPEASKFFKDVNHLDYSLPDWPYVQMDRLTVINDDGRNYLASTDRTYDIIMSEPSNPWITGVSDLFTTDHFRITKRSLNPGGIYCQWVQLYELSPENIKTIYRTFASQFRHVVVFTAEDLSSDTVLLGSDSPLPLDLERIRRPFALPGVRDELERAYVHSPFDVMARTILASRDEVLQYTQIEYRMRGGEWEAVPESSNGTECSMPSCRREPSPLNTDDNALIEFAAPRDLIGFQRYEGYLANIYSPDWPYANLLDEVRGFGEGDEAARHYSEMAMALIAHGRKGEAAEFIRRAFESGRVREAQIATEVLTLLLSDDHEPRIAIEPPVPGPQMDQRTGRRLSDGFEAVRQSVDLRAWTTALTAMEEIPAPLRLHSGPGMRFLYAYLLYKAAEGSPSRYRAAIDQLEDLVRSDEEYVRRHPELYYFLARAHDAEFNFDKALRNMRTYVEAAVVPRDDALDLPEPSIGEAPTTDDPGESPKGTHPDRT
jgi:spermidine synthase